MCICWTLKKSRSKPGDNLHTLLIGTVRQSQATRLSLLTLSLLTLSLLTISKRWLTVPTCNMKADILDQMVLAWLTVTDDKVKADIRLP